MAAVGSPSAHGQVGGSDDPAANLELGLTDEPFRLSLSATDAEEIDGLIVQLASPAFDQREQATDRLVNLGLAAFGPLREAYARTADLEVELRIESIVFESYLNRAVFPHWGYLGIEHDGALTSQHEPRISRGKVGFRIKVVQPNSAAERGGLQQGDVIIELDGKELVGDVHRGWGLFAYSVRKRGPGTQVVLTILRGAEQLNLSVILGQPPDSRVFQQIPGYSEVYDRIRIPFVDWWEKYFRSWPGRENGGFEAQGGMS